jgi:hypothetical protein
MMTPMEINPLMTDSLKFVEQKSCPIFDSLGIAGIQTYKL